VPATQGKANPPKPALHFISLDISWIFKIADLPSTLSGYYPSRIKPPFWAGTFPQFQALNFTMPRSANKALLKEIAVEFIPIGG